jgi:DNA segregation ATPase FtsK/SpoIIIE-like protein
MGLEVGESSRPIEAVASDLARELGVASLELENDPDRPQHIRFLLARKDRVFPELPEAAPFLDTASSNYLGIYLGADLIGRPYPSFMSTWPHALIGGTTGSGKTTLLKSIAKQAALSGATSLVIIDGKGETDYIGLIPGEAFHPRYPDVLSGHDSVPGVFKWLVQEEIPRRRSIVVSEAKRRSGQPWSARAHFVATRSENGGVEPFPALLVIVDEFAQLMLQTSHAGDFSLDVQQVAQVGRSLLVHLILATQRPEARIVSGAIKANLNTRIALRLPTATDSLTILGRGGAEKLLGQGDMIFQSAAEPAVRLQGFRA